MKSKVASALPQLLLALLVLAIVASLGVAGLRLRERLNAPPPDTPNAAHALASTTERALIAAADAGTNPIRRNQKPLGGGKAK